MKHFHTKETGCDLKDIIILKKTGGKHQYNEMKALYCETHKVRACACGWEFGWHYGESAKALEKKEKKFWASKKGQKIKKEDKLIRREYELSRNATRN